jgi:hypothetical protein
MRRAIVWTGAVFLLISVVWIGITSADTAPAFNIFTGTYVSELCEPLQNSIYVRRFMTLTIDRWFLQVQWFNGSSSCLPQNLYFTMEFSGFYTYGYGTTTVARGYPADFQVSQRQITAASVAGVNWLSSLGCGSFAMNQPRDVGISGCAALGIQTYADCPQEYDVLVSNYPTRLYLGTRQTNLCSPSGRPSSVQSYALTSVTPPSIVGLWMGSCDLLELNLYIQTELSATTTSYSTIVRYYSDPDCRTPLFNRYQRGAYLVWGPSPFVVDAYEVQYTVSTAALFPASSEGVSFLQVSCNASASLFVLNQFTDASSVRFATFLSPPF